jgi:hypothetical protein
MIQSIAKRALFAAGLFLVPAVAADQPQQDAKAPEPVQDQRFSQVKSFFELKKSPLVDYASAFLEAADKYSLDWRLLPCLAQVESAGGRIIRNNNVFGWGNGRVRFQSVQESIHLIAERLANGASYRNKTTEGKLRAYNPRNRRYADHVLEMMALIGPAGAPAAAVTATLEAATAPAN